MPLTPLRRSSRLVMGAMLGTLDRSSPLAQQLSFAAFYARLALLLFFMRVLIWVYLKTECEETKLQSEVHDRIHRIEK